MTYPEAASHERRLGVDLGHSLNEQVSEKLLELRQVRSSDKIRRCINIVRAVVGTEELAHVVPEASICEVSG